MNFFSGFARRTVMLIVMAGGVAGTVVAQAQTEPQAGQRPALSEYFSLGPGENSYSHDHSSQAKRLSSSQKQDIARAISLINERLALMPDVARYKWNRSLPIEDPERERQLLSKLVRKGVALGLDPRVTQSYFADQISAAKLLQRGYYARWQSKRPRPTFNPPDLATQQRPRIDDVTNRMLHSLVTLRNISLRPDGSSALRTAAMAELRANDAASRDVLTVALRPLLQGLPVEKWKSLKPGAAPVAR
ncbi:MAG: gamma subclass chorismate mutase AroQ [Candidatus Methylacidiphilales bacterium]